MKFSDSSTLPYYAVIFTALKTEDQDGYEEMVAKMHKIVEKQPGFLGIESAQEETEITISYWESLEAIANWKNNLEHLAAQKLGKEQFYRQFKVRICKVEREYSFEK